MFVDKQNYTIWLQNHSGILFKGKGHLKIFKLQIICSWLKLITNKFDQ